MDSNKLKHLEMIQGIISRMGGNLFILKGWAVTLVVALFTIIANKLDGVYIFFPIGLILVFWFLDGQYLSIERCYRDLYDSVRVKKEKEIDFSMNFKKYMKGKNTWFRSTFSRTLNLFYGVLLALVLVITLSLNLKLVKISIDWQSNNCNSCLESVRK